MRTIGFIALSGLAALALVAGCRSLQELKPPYHEPAVATAAR